MRIARMHVACSFGSYAIGGCDETRLFAALPEEMFRPERLRKRCRLRRERMRERALRYVEQLGEA